MAILMVIPHALCGPHTRIKMTSSLPTVIPAQAGIQGWVWGTHNYRLPRGTLDSRFRGNDGARQLPIFIRIPHAPCRPHMRMKMVRLPNRHSRESGSPPHHPWIPAYAGMTVGRDAAPFRVRWGNLALAIFTIMTVTQKSPYFSGMLPPGMIPGQRPGPADARLPSVPPPTLSPPEGPPG